jgi:hypothetical protein
VWRYRLGVRTEDSQSSNPGSIPGSATKVIDSLLPTASAYTDLFQNCAILDRQSIGTAVLCSDSKARCGDEKELRDFPPPGSFLLL